MLTKGEFMKIYPVVLTTALLAVSALGQEAAKASMSPPEVVAGKSITITIKLDKPLKDGAQLQAFLGPKDLTQPGAGPANLIATTDPLVYRNTETIPITGKGVWTIREVRIVIPASLGTPPIVKTDEPEFTVKPVPVELPTSGSVKFTIP